MRFWNKKTILLLGAASMLAAGMSGCANPGKVTGGGKLLPTLRTPSSTFRI